MVKGRDKVKEKEPLVKGTTIAGKEPLEKGSNLKNAGAKPAAPAASAAAPAASAAAPAASAAATAASAAAPAASAAAPAAAPEASTGKNEKATPLKKGKVMVDCHWTLEVNEVIPPENRTAMKVLLKKGYDIVVCTWCFPKRREEVLATLEKEDWFTKVTFIATQTRTGDGGKAAICKDTGCTAIFDDGTDILEDCEQAGIEVFQVKKKTGPYKGNQKKPLYETLAGAVEEFLKRRKDL